MPFRETPALLPTRRAVCAGIAATAAAPSFAEPVSAEALMLASYEASRFANVRFRATLTIETRTSSARVRELSGVAKITDKGKSTARLMRVSAPSDMRGVATLTLDRQAAADDLWVYLPSLRRVRRLVASNRRDPWMGSDFSYGDIVGHDVSEWGHAVLRKDSVDGQACVVVESKPLRKALVSETGYARRLSWLREADKVVLKAEFFGPSGAPLKIMEASQVRLVDKAAGKSQAMHIVMKRERGQSTLMFNEFRIDQTVDDSEVAPEALTQ